MKLLLLSDPVSPHTIKWANALASNGIKIHIFGFSPIDHNLFSEGIDITTGGISPKLRSQPLGTPAKLIYLASLYRIKKIIREFKPDIIHSHYVSSYGLVGAMTNFHPFAISVWGLDIYNFPEKSIFHEFLIRKTLNKADIVLSTSNVMKKQAEKYTSNKIEVIPFGIDTNVFKPIAVNSLFGPDDIIIGTIKTLERKYGIEYLIRSFGLLKKKLSHLPLKLLIVGGGSLEYDLKLLVKKLGLQDFTIFTGFVTPDKIPVFHNMLDIYLSLSVEDSESFGVAVLEASACEKPVIVSNVGGLPEVVENNVTGFVVENQNIYDVVDKLEKLILDKELRAKMGSAGRDRVIRCFNWKENIKQMINIYDSLVRE